MDPRRSRPYKYAAKYSVAVVMLAFTAALVLVVGAFLLSVTLWSFITKMFVYTYFMEIKLDTTFFDIPAGFICFPSVVLTILLKSNKLSYMLALVCLQIIATGLLFTGYFIGMVYKLNFSNETVRLESTIPREALNNTLYNLIAIYEKSPGNETTMDNIQFRFRCCGIDSKDDFIKIPESCCPKSDCDNLGVWPRGCLRSIQENVAWLKHLNSSLTQLFILMYVFNLAMVSSVFISDRYKWRSLQRTRNRQSR